MERDPLCSLQETVDAEPPSQLDDLLKHRAFLERFALSLVRNAGVAEDVVQETWLAAIERPPRHGANLRAWLRQVALYKFLRRQRSHSATDAVESLSAEPVDEPCVLEERESIARLVASELLALPEPYRGVLTLRYYEDRTPSEIAHALGRPLNTVTSQLARGLKLMQERLDRSRPGGRSEWVHALVALVPTAAPSMGPRPALARAPRATRHKAGLAAAVVAVATVVLFLRDRSPEGTSRATEVTSRAAPMAGSELDAGAQDSSRAPDPVPTAPVAASRVEVVAEDPPAAIPEPALLSRVRVEVVDEDGRPVPEATVQTARSVAAPGSSEIMTRFAGTDLTDASGRVELPLTDEQRARLGMEDLGELGLIVHKVGFAASDIHVLPFPEDGVVDATIRLQRSSAIVTGVVSDAHGAPVEGAYVEMGPGGGGSVELGGGRSLLRSPVVRMTDADGRYEHIGMPPGTLAVFVACHGFVPHVGSFEAPDSSTTVHDVVLHRGGAVTGRAETAEGLAAQGARIRVEFMLTGPNPVAQEAEADADGRFELQGVVPGQAWLFAEHAGLSAVKQVTFVAGETFTWDPVLREMPPLWLRVQREDGSPLAGSLVLLESTQENETWKRYLMTEADGRVRFEAVPACELMASVFLSPQDMDHDLPPCFARTGLHAATDEHVLNVPRERMARGSLCGVLLDDGGRPFPKAVLQLRPRGGQNFYPTPVSAETGAFRNERLAAQSYELVALCAGLGTVRIDEIEVFANDTFDLGEIRLPRTIVWSPTWTDATADSYELVKLDALEDREERWKVAWGAAPPPPSFDLFPGRYEWRLFGAGELLGTRGFELP